MASVQYSLEEFIGEMDGLLESQPDQGKLFDVGSVHLERLIRNPDAIPAKYRVPGLGGWSGHSGDGASYILHQGENGLSIMAVVWDSGDHVGPHDHRTWGMIGVMDSSITETRFRRVDDRSREGYAVLEKGRVTEAKPGEISLLIPDVDEIHQMDNETDRPTVELHVYGRDLRGLERERFDLEAGTVTAFTTKKYDNC